MSNAKSTGIQRTNARLQLRPSDVGGSVGGSQVVKHPWRRFNQRWLKSSLDEKVESVLKCLQQARVIKRQKARKGQENREVEENER